MDTDDGDSGDVDSAADAAADDDDDDAQCLEDRRRAPTTVRLTGRDAERQWQQSPKTTTMTLCLRLGESTWRMR